MPDLPPTSVKPPTDPDEPGGTGRHEGTPTPALPSIHPGTVIAGKYKLLEPLGEGGMGAVWMAQQTDPVKRLVAVKLIKAGMDSKTVLARFEAERQALSMMDHPNIARVLDVGTTAAGHPFFVMELVKGTPITDFCDARKLTPRQRLELFVPVCQAIQHAHQKGIIHRDIKPTNVLVALHDDRPVPKVIDFGVAKAIGTPLTEKTLHTGFEQVVGTPAYMSPEQATFNQLDIDTRSDVYSLGVLLYELLTGTTPIERERFKKAAIVEMLRVVREEEPPRPSTRLSSTESRATIAAVRGMEPAKLSREFRGELDWIAMKALEKDRARRYETANGLVADVQRYLTGEPVLAHPPSPGYRLRKFVRKNRRPVAAAALVFLALVAGIAGTTAGLLRAREKEHDALNAAEEERKARDREAAQATIARQKEKEAQDERKVAVAQRERAEKARDRTREVLDLMTSKQIGDSLAEQVFATEQQKQFLKEVLTYYQEFAGEKADDELSRKRTAAAAARVGRIQDSLRRPAEAVAAYNTARDLYGALVADFPAVRDYRAALARVHYRLGFLLLGIGRQADAQPEFRTTLALLDTLGPAGPGDPGDDDHIRAFSGHELGRFLASRGKRAEAEAEYRKALPVFEKLVAQHGYVYIRSALAECHDALATLLHTRGKLAEAEAHQRGALATFVKLDAENPGSHRYQVARSYSRLGYLLEAQRKLAEAEAEFRRAAMAFEKLDTDLPNSTSYSYYRQMLAKCHEHRAILLYTLSRHTDAVTEQRAALAIYEKLTADFPAQFSPFTPSHAQARIGESLVDRGKIAAAEPVLRECLAIRQKHTPDTWWTPYTESYLGEALAGQAKYAEAEPLLVRSYDRLAKVAVPVDWEQRVQDRRRTNAEHLARLYHASGKPAEAAKWRAEAKKYPFVAPPPHMVFR